MPEPLLIIVTGRPGSGKSTLARILSDKIFCPHISRDAIKEGLVNTLEKNTADMNRQVYTIFFDTIRFLLDRQISLIAEAAFVHQVWQPQLEPLIDHTRMRIIVCDVDKEIAKSRFIQRAKSDPARAKFHDDWTDEPSQALIDFLNRDYEPPLLSVPTLTVDTSDGYKPDLDAISAFVKSRVI